MRQIRTFFYLPFAQQSLLGQSVLLLGAIRLGLWLLPFRTVGYLVARATQGSPELHEAAQVSIDRIVWSVTVASRCIPEATCLTQALATQVLLTRRGHPVNLRIGVARNEAGEFQAHAWVEYQGRVIIGGAEAPAHYTPLPLEGKRL
jgi:hypothetical protein